jgi:hypothetical protein
LTGGSQNGDLHGELHFLVAGPGRIHADTPAGIG